MSAPLADTFGLIGQRLDGKYEVEDVVAQGGFAVVYRARHLALQKPVAVKVLRVPDDLHGPAREHFLSNFAREAQTIASLDHPAIVKVIDFGTSPMPVGDAAPWMVLEWLAGQTLDADLSARRGRGGRPPAECLAMLRPVIEALAYAHDEGVVHRDVKPGNLMLVESRRGDRTARVLDFGIAKVMSGDESAPVTGLTATHTHGRTFSLFYASPEQIAGTRSGPWTDVYALALVLTEMLTDEAPYSGSDVQEVYIDALSPVRPTPARRGVDVGDWEPVLARALSLKPAERFPDARTFLAALDLSVPAAAVRTTPPPRFSVTPADTFQPAQRPPTAPSPLATGGRLRALKYAALGALGAYLSVVSWRHLSPAPQPDAPVTVRVVAEPAPQPAPPAPLPVAPAPAPSPAPAAPLEAARDAGVTADAGVAVARLARPVARPPLRPVVRRPTPEIRPNATGREIIPAE